MIKNNLEECCIDTSLISSKDLSSELIQLLIINVNSCFKLTKEQINVLKNIIINDSCSIIYLHNCLLEIIIDGKINSIDVPIFMLIIQDIYIICNKINIIKDSDINIIITPIIKYIIYIFLIKNNLDSCILLNCCNSIIEISVQMIQLKTTVKNKHNTFKLC